MTYSYRALWPINGCGPNGCDPVERRIDCPCYNARLVPDGPWVKVICVRCGRLYRFKSVEEPEVVIEAF
jgi:hypothetical protein